MKHHKKNRWQIKKYQAVTVIQTLSIKWSKNKHLEGVMKQCSFSGIKAIQTGKIRHSMLRTLPTLLDFYGVEYQDIVRHTGVCMVSNG